MAQDVPRSSTYYAKGSEEVASETALTLKKLETRRNLTRDSERLVIVLVGLPARGKSFISRKLLNFLNWSGYRCRTFNVGRYRREAYAHIAQEGEHEGRAEMGACDANFFDSKNEAASQLRQQVAEAALRDMLKWLDGEHDDDEANLDASVKSDASSHHNKTGGDRIAIFDATNSTNQRRSWILEESTSPTKRAGKPTGVVFVESICDDEELLRQNYKFKVSSSPDFQDMDEETALEDLKKRVAKYEETYETITDDSQSYIKIFNLSSKLMVNHIYGRMAKVIVPAIMAWNVGTRPVFLCRPGKTPHIARADSEDYVCRSDSKGSDLSNHNNRKGRAEKLGPTGIRFRDALEEFIAAECTDFLQKQQEIASHPSLYTGTSLTGLSSYRQEVGLDGNELPFACTILCSTMPRSADTVMWETLPFPVAMNPHLNPLDKGDFEGMELDEILREDPKWYARLEADPYSTRFPGGESYKDLIKRLESPIIDMEQQTAPVLIVSHVSVLQALIAYFRQSPADQCMNIEVPMHTVLKFTPSRGGGWVESRHELLPDDGVFTSSKSMANVTSESELSVLSWSDHVASSPIWGDHVHTSPVSPRIARPL